MGELATCVVHLQVVVVVSSSFVCRVVQEESFGTCYVPPPSMATIRVENDRFLITVGGRTGVFAPVRNRANGECLVETVLGNDPAYGDAVRDQLFQDSELDNLCKMKRLELAFEACMDFANYKGEWSVDGIAQYGGSVVNRKFMTYVVLECIAAGNSEHGGVLPDDTVRAFGQNM